MAADDDLSAAVRRLAHEVTAALPFGRHVAHASEPFPGDVDRVARLLTAHVLDWIANAVVDAVEVLDRRWPDVEALADRLLAERTVTESSPP